MVSCEMEEKMEIQQTLDNILEVLINPEAKLKLQLEFAAKMHMSYNERQFFSASEIVNSTKKAMMIVLGLTEGKETYISLKQESVLPVLEYLNHYGCQLRKKIKTEKEETFDDFYDLYPTSTQNGYEEYMVVRK